MNKIKEFLVDFKRRINMKYEDLEYKVYFHKMLKDDVVEKLVSDKKFVKVLDNIISYSKGKKCKNIKTINDLSYYKYKGYRIFFITHEDSLVITSVFSLNWINQIVE